MKANTKSTHWQQKEQQFKKAVHEVIFETNTFWGKFFDIALLILIALSIITLMLESIKSYQTTYHDLFNRVEWFFTIAFTLEYLFRLYSTKKTLKYATSFYGIIDFIAILPSFIDLFFTGTHFLLIFRAMRLLRVFRIFKLIKFVDQSNTLFYSLKASWRKISFFLFFILIIVCVIGTLMYMIEGNIENSNFSNIPVSIYWAIVTLTTVGYGDISPTTPLGQFLASAIMILGYSIIAVPTGIITAEIANSPKGNEEINTQVCQNCSEEHHLPDANYCHNCGNKLEY